MTSLRVVTDPDPRSAARPHADDPRDPELFRSGIASARAALRDGVARRHDREVLEAVADPEEPS